MYLQVSVIELVISQKIVQYYSSGIEIYNSLIAESKEREGESSGTKPKSVIKKIEAW